MAAVLVPDTVPLPTFLNTNIATIQSSREGPGRAIRASEAIGMVRFRPPLIMGGT